MVDEPKPLPSSRSKLKHLARTLGRVDIAAVRAELTEAADRSLDQHHPEDEPDNCAVASLYELDGAELTPEERQATLKYGLRAVRALTRERDEARAWAWSYCHRRFRTSVTGEDNPPEWLLAERPALWDEPLSEPSS